MKNPFKREKKEPSLGAYGGLFRSVRTREKRRRFGFLGRKWVVISLVLLVLFGGTGAYAAWYYYSLQGDVQTRIPEVTPPETREQPFIALLVGSDSREGLTEEEQHDLGASEIDETGQRITGERADTLILAHIDPETNKVIMVQFPRDLYVEFPDGEMRKINEALLEGRNELVKTLEHVTGLDINRYAQVNIAGFRDLVDAIDGVDVCVPEAIPFDDATGIEVTEDEIGMVHFDGDRALRFVRSRKVFAEGDFARIQNQQKFLAAAIGKVTSPATFLDLGRLRELKRVAGDNLKIDDNTTLIGLYRLLQRFRAFDPENYEAYVVPNFGSTEITLGSGGELSIVEADIPTMDVMWEALRSNSSPASADDIPDVDISDIRVGVYNGIGEEGAAARAARELEEAARVGGETIVIDEEANADRSNYRRTVIRYEPGRGKEEMAQFIAALIPGARLREGDTKLGIDVAVIVGQDFEARRLIRIEPIDLPVPGDLPAVCR